MPADIKLCIHVAFSRQKAKETFSAMCTGCIHLHKSCIGCSKLRSGLKVVRSQVRTRKGHPILKALHQFQDLTPEGLSTTPSAFGSNWKQCGMQVPKGLKEELVEEAKECALGCTSKISCWGSAEAWHE